jgi:hypothetical protein
VSGFVRLPTVCCNSGNALCYSDKHMVQRQGSVEATMLCYNDNGVVQRQRSITATLVCVCVITVLLANPSESVTVVAISERWSSWAWSLGMEPLVLANGLCPSIQFSVLQGASQTKLSTACTSTPYNCSPGEWRHTAFFALQQGTGSRAQGTWTSCPSNYCA